MYFCIVIENGKLWMLIMKCVWGGWPNLSSPFGRWFITLSCSIRIPFTMSNEISQYVYLHIFNLFINILTNGLLSSLMASVLNLMSFDKSDVCGMCIHSFYIAVPLYLLSLWLLLVQLYDQFAKISWHCVQLTNLSTVMHCMVFI